ncbi:MAG: hypothetical protein ACRC3J_09345 [Culicoidibacterales bacterium]
MNTTLSAIRNAYACAEGYNKLVRGLTDDYKEVSCSDYLSYYHPEPISFKQIFDICGLYDAIWCLRLAPRKMVSLYSIKLLEIYFIHLINSCEHYRKLVDTMYNFVEQDNYDTAEFSAFRTTMYDLYCHHLSKTNRAPLHILEFVSAMYNIVVSLNCDYCQTFPAFRDDGRIQEREKATEIFIKMFGE